MYRVRIVVQDLPDEILPEFHFETVKELIEFINICVKNGQKIYVKEKE